MAEPKNLLIPMKLDAFVFNEAVCNGGPKDAKIAPIIQPNYTSLRLNDYLVEPDILDHTDLHNASPADRNSRFTDLGTNLPRTNRQGVYLHWLLPRPYRGGTAATDSSNQSEKALHKKGLRAQDDKKKQVDVSAPQFPAVPNRWLVIRKLDPKASSTVPTNTSIAPIQAWVVESDRRHNIDNLGANVDLQVDVAPFITSVLQDSQSSEDIRLDEQAEVFIGYREDASTWKETYSAKPRVGLTVASSSNQLFPDLQYHCGNVFSMLDTFEYTENGAKKTLVSAKADYYVIGWKAESANDILFSDPSHAISRQDRLAALNMRLNDQENATGSIADWLKSTDSSRTLCHGAMYDVEWKSSALPTTVLANKFSEKLNEDMPIAIGTTPTDSILAYVNAHHQPDGSLADNLNSLAPLLRAQDDSLDSLISAADEVQSHNFAHFDGGSQFTFADTENAKEPAKAPSDPDKKNMRELNSAQRFLDAILRRMQQLRWDLFSVWWKFISDHDNLNGRRDDAYRAEVADINDLLTALAAARDNVQRLINGWIGVNTQSLRSNPQSQRITEIDIEARFEVQPKKGTLTRFSQQRDPTLLIGGVGSGWPRDFQDKLLARLDNQVITQPDNPELGKPYGLDCLPSEIKGSGSSAVKEFLLLAQKTSFEESPAGKYFPLYHDGQSSDNPGPTNPWRDRWASTQPWFPLYVEWEAEYTHIPFASWEIMERPSRFPPPDNKYTYGLILDVRDKYKEDVRLVSGRNLILPQPSFNLKAQIEQLFSSVPPTELDKHLDKTRREDLKKNLDKMAYLSCPLEGLTHHLTTTYSGNHVKPLVREPGVAPRPLRDARDAAIRIGLTMEKLALIDKESDPTPYGPNGSLLDLQLPAFKPATHGQLRFRKINIIDKFGQAIHAIDPKAKEGSLPVYPCVSEFYSPQPVSQSKNIPNVVDPSRSDKPGHCEFIQLPPYINQPARLNCTFVMHDEKGEAGSYWRPSLEWENPIWGWVVVNYVDQGLQLYQPDGTFYREVRVTQGTNGSTKWLPFDHRKSATEGPKSQLDRLIDELLSKDQIYLLSFVDMITDALDRTTVPPSSYGQFVNALVGRPLALVNMGWSLELATAPKKTQSTLNNQKNLSNPWGLLPDPQNLKVYSFPVKFGDKGRANDGLVGYFNSFDQFTRRPDDDLQLKKIYTYFQKNPPDDPDKKSPIKIINNENYPHFKCWWLDLNDKNAGFLAKDGHLEFERQRNKRFQVYGALIDPFLPVTAYTSLLPVQSLKLPTWTWESALKKMTGFFHAGPIILDTDIPDFMPSKKLSSEDSQYLKNEPVEATATKVPALPVADWAWLQPYTEGFMALDISKEQAKLNLERGPKTAIEGYLQMRAPIVEDKQPKKEKI
ncbi:hypothetical protein EYR41_008891 [Orbilia oligospora]|uniref:Uncharacterized protein n=1 Tax=Orbilia oligospora TaxID=2813651 RepID=A0A8H2DU60_ORBOL|nr:hypothetical protein EYR41_008891 [Orbilia oligospora]